MTSNKGVIIATLFVGVLSAAVALFIHFDGPSEGLMTKDTKNEQANNDEKKVEPTPSLNWKRKASKLSLAFKFQSLGD